MSWEKVRLGEILNYEQPTNYIVESDSYDNSYPTPVLTAGKSFILGYTNEFNGVYNNLPAIIFDDFTTVSKYVDFKFKVKSSAMKILTCDTKRANLRFLYYLLQTINFDAEQHKRYWISTYANFEIPLPPLKTQKRIVDILDAADALRQKDQELLKKYDELAQAVFIDMFGDPVKNEKRWEILPLEKLCLDIVDCPHTTPNHVPEITDYPCIRTSEMKNGKISWASMKYLNHEEYLKRVNRLIPKAGDIVYAREGTYGNAVLLPDMYNFSLGQRTMLLRPNLDLLNNEFLWYQINSDFVYKQAKRKNMGSTVGHVNVADVRKFDIMVPPLSIQIKFSKIITYLFNSELYIQNDSTVELFNSLIQKAFKGELVA